MQPPYHQSYPAWSRLEIRQAGDNTLLVAKSYVTNGDESGPQLIGEKMLAVMKDELDLPP